ncbi:hypothetical protein SLE2022_177650 [Rubroshorea leprosula]
MVFQSISGEETPEKTITNRNERTPPPMTSSTMKSQPLHNFSLPDLKWAMNHPNTNRFRKLTIHDTDSDSESRRRNQAEVAKYGAASSSSGHRMDNFEKKKVTYGSDSVVESSEKKSTAPDGRSKILIRLKTKSQKPAEEVADTGDQNFNAEDTDEFVAKTWNLRPRKPIPKAPNAGGGGIRIGGPAVQRPEPTRSRNPTEGKAAEKKEKKPKFSISLTREEIDDDIFAMTGSRPSRRPKKRAKNVQKQLDCIFPGLWLPSITPDSYKVPDAPTKV